VTYYEDRATGPSVAFVHGAILDHAQWDFRMDALGDEYRTIVYDVRGHGRTGGSARERYSVELFADDLDNPEFFTAAVREFLAERAPRDHARGRDIDAGGE
jgi:alpha-beta hydrolase superfamily lysophospholipase